MRLIASDLLTYHRPSKCERRVFLSLGQQHERDHVSSFGEYVEIAKFPRDERVKATLDSIAQRVPVIYQPMFVGHQMFAGIDVEIEGIPDLIIRDGNGYLIRDVKMAPRLDGDN